MYAEREHAAQSSGRLGALDALSAGIPAELTVFVKKTYALLAFSLVLAGAACVGMLRLMPTAEVHLRGGGTAVVPDVSMLLVWGLWGGTLVFSLIGNFAKKGARSGEVSALGLAALCGMVLCSGAMLAPTIGIYVGLGMAKTVAAAAVVTAVSFTALTLVVFATGKDFGFMGKFLLVAGIAFFVAWLVGAFFVKSAGFQWWLAAIGAVLFCGYILFDTSSVVRFYGPNNLVVPAVISLYLDIFNLFVMLLYLLGGSRRNN